MAVRALRPGFKGGSPEGKEDSTLYFTPGQSVGHQPCVNLGLAQNCITKLSHLDLNCQIPF